MPGCWRLVHQVPGDTERYAVQRLPASRALRGVTPQLSEPEWHAKLAVRDEVYSLLRAQLGPVLGTLPDTHFACEEIAPAPSTLPVPDAERVLRYEWRGKLRRQRGDVDRVITYAEHFLPVAQRLV